MQKAGIFMGNIKKIKNIWSKVLNLSINLLLPLRCPVCDEPVRLGEGFICHNCYKKLEVIKEPVCFRCGKPLHKAEQEYCRDCGHKEHAFICGRALYVYESMHSSIYRFKYCNRQEYAIFFGREMAAKLTGFIAQIDADALLPVPISKERYEKRGYNQAELLAKELGKQLCIPVFTDLVERTKDTLPQKGLNALERQKNLKKAFKIVQNDVKLNTIIIVDDIYTTGSTIDALSKVLLSSGVKKVYFVALALATGA